MKSLKKLREDIDVQLGKESKRVKKALEESRMIEEADLLEAVQSIEFDAEEDDNRRDPPPVIVMRRKAIRTFPNGKRVALYFAQQINKFFTVPYDVKSPSNKEDKNVAG